MSGVSPAPTADVGPSILLGFNDGTTSYVDKSSRIGGTWESVSLARGRDKGADYTIKEIFVEYICDGASTLKVEASADGGVTWTTVSITTSDTNGGVEEKVAHFNITGKDPRVRFDLGLASDNIRIIGLKARMIERANLGE